MIFKSPILSGARTQIPWGYFLVQGIFAAETKGPGSHLLGVSPSPSLNVPRPTHLQEGGGVLSRFTRA